MKTRRQFLSAVGKGGVALSMTSIFGSSLTKAGSSTTSQQNNQRKPNILFFLTDDQRNDTLGCAGHQIVKTPVIDGLAREGVRFENMFVTTPICAASRASIFTGVCARTHGYSFGIRSVPMSSAQTNYPLMLKQAGYQTGFIGKYGCQMEVRQNEMFDYYQPIGSNPYLREMPDGSRRHETDICADRAIEFLNTQSEDQPFCLSVSFNASHAVDNDRRPGIGHFPWPPSTDGMYEDVAIPQPRLSDPQIYESQPDFLKESLNRERYFWRWDTPEKFETNMRAYFRMLSGIDNAIGRVIKTLEEKNLADNTVIIYSADNGYFMGDRGFAGKWNHYDQALRVPLVVYDPRLPQDKRNRVVSSLALNIDFAATFLDLAGIEIPSNYQGKSLLPVTNGSAENVREDFFCEHLTAQRGLPKWEGVRSQDYKYACYFEQQPAFEFLFNLHDDPDELNNLALDPEYQDTLTKMRQRTEEFKKNYS